MKVRNCAIMHIPRSMPVDIFCVDRGSELNSMHIPKRCYIKLDYFDRFGAVQHPHIPRSMPVGTFCCVDRGSELNSMHIPKRTSKDEICSGGSELCKYAYTETIKNIIKC